MNKQIGETPMRNADELGLLLRKKHNISVMGQPMYEYLVRMAQHGASVEKILSELPVDILVNPQEFAEQICRAAQYRTYIAEYDAFLLGKPQNKSGETASDGYAKTAGKPQNKSDNFSCRDYTNLDIDLNNIGYCLVVEPNKPSIDDKIESVRSGRSAFEVMQDIHVKDGVFLCYDKTIIAALHTPDGVFLGTNGIKKQPSQHICPRKGRSVNQGYGKCVEQCQQPAHAELAALLKYKTAVAKPDFENSHMVVYGAKDVCYHCKKTLELVGIQSVTIKPIKQLGELNEYQ